MRFRFAPTRASFIPKGAVKVTDKATDAVAYFWSVAAGVNAGKPGVTVFVGKQNRPVVYGTFGGADGAKRREEEVRRTFRGRAASLTMKAEARAARRNFVPTAKVGDIYVTCWGWEQTNREFYEIVSMTAKTAMVRRVAEVVKERVNMQGTKVPLPGEYVGEPIKVVFTDHNGFKVDGHHASPADYEEPVPGVRAYKPAAWSSYA